MNIEWHNGEYSIRKASGDSPSIRVLFAGDYCPRFRPEEVIMAGKGEDIFREALPVLHDKDISWVNLEAPLTRRDSGILKEANCIKLDPRCLEPLEQARFDVIGLANNHMGDFGAEGAVETIQECRHKGFEISGAGTDIEDARRWPVLEANGLRVAFLCYAQKEFGLAGRGRPGVNRLDVERAVIDILRAKRDADLVVVMPHYGFEWTPFPSPRTIETYHAFIEAGASAVIGAHSHCPQSVEIYNGAPILYSIGNFLFDAHPEKPRDIYAPDSFWWRGMLANIQFGSEGALSLKIVPFTFAPDATRVKLYAEEDQERFFAYINKISEPLPDPVRLRQLWVAWCHMIGETWMQELSNFEWPPDRETPEGRYALIRTRQALTCNIENELASTLADRAYEGLGLPPEADMQCIRNLQICKMP